MSSEQIRVAARLSRVKPSITMAVSARAAELRAAGVDVLSFGAGEPDFDTPEHIKQAARDALAGSAASNYTHVRGLAPFREAIAAELSRANGIELGVDNIIVNCGAKHSIYNICVALVDDGDEVIVPAPYWVSYPEMVRLCGGEPVIVETRADNGFALEPEALEKAITPKTRMIIINNPSNPTGGVYSRAQMEAVVEVLARHDIWVVSDDIYRNLIYGDAEWVSIPGLSKEVAKRTIIVDGVSKSYAMTGWRIGYTAAPPPVIAAISKVQSQSTSGASHIAQLAAMEAITGSQECVAEMKKAFNERRLEMVRLLNDIPGVECREPKGAFYAFPDVSALIGKSADGVTIEDDVALANYLVEKGRVAMVPGSGFGAPGFLRLSYACSMENIREGVGRMAAALGELK